MWSNEAKSAGSLSVEAGIISSEKMLLKTLLSSYYGTVLGPMGAVIFVDFWLIKKFGLQDEYAHKTNQAISVPVLVAWLLPVTVGLYLIFWQGLFAAYAVIPCWIACGVIYLTLRLLNSLPKIIPKIISLAALVVALVPNLLYFCGLVEPEPMKWITLGGTIAWFVFTPMWIGVAKR